MLRPLPHTPGRAAKLMRTRPSRTAWTRASSDWARTGAASRPSIPSTATSAGVPRVSPFIAHLTVR